MNRLRYLILATVSLLCTPCIAGGGPNPFEGSNIFGLLSGLLVVPIVGYLVAFVFMAATGKFVRAVGMTIFLVLLLGALATLGNDIGFIGVVLFGPWVLFVGLLLSYLLPNLSAGAGIVNHSSSSSEQPSPSPWSRLP